MLFKNNLRSGGSICVYVDNELYGEFSLDEDNTYDITKDSSVLCTVLISKGRADVVSASCPDKLCVSQQSISLDGESICCLPNRVYITVENDSGVTKYDALTK